MVAVRYQGDESENIVTRRTQRNTIARRAVLIWPLLVIAYFAWEMLSYRGLYAIASEAQFAGFGRSFPLGTFIVLVVLFSLPALLLRKLFPKPTEDVDSYFPDRSVLARAQRFQTLVGRVAIGFAAAAVLIGVFALVSTPPRFGAVDRSRVIDASVSRTSNGPAVVRGDLRFSKAATHSFDAVLVRYQSRLVPITAPGENAKLIRFVAEYPPGDSPDTMRDVPGAERAGMVMAGHVPEAVLALYRQAGFEIAEPVYLVGQSRSTFSAPYWALAVVAIVGILVAGIVLLFQRRHVRTLLKDHQATQIDA